VPTAWASLTISFFIASATGDELSLETTRSANKCEAEVMGMCGQLSQQFSECIATEKTRYEDWTMYKTGFSLLK